MKQVIQSISFHIVFGLVYPCILLVAMWNGVGKYFDGCRDNGGNWYPNYSNGIKLGWKEFKRVHTSVYNKCKPNTTNKL